MPKRRARDVTVGAVFALGLIILALAVMTVGNETGLFFEEARYTVPFPDADGLLVGAPVRMAGVQIGTVASIRLPTDPRAQGIEVEVSIKPAYAERIRQDSRGALRILQVLTNEKFVEILPGSTESPAVPPGGRIARLEQRGVFERGEAIAENLTEITVSLKNILEPLERGEGLLGQMLHDPQFGRDGLASMRATLDNLNVISARLARGEGLAGRLLTDRGLAGKLDQASRSVDTVSEIVDRVARGEGALGELLREDGPAERAILDLAETSRALRGTIERLEGQQGLVGKLLYDPEYSERVSQDLERSVRDLGEILNKLNRGEGTLGALINDPTLYDGVDEIINGVHDSDFARWLARHYRKKGIKAEQEAAKKAEQEKSQEQEN